MAVELQITPGHVVPEPTVRLEAEYPRIAKAAEVFTGEAAARTDVPLNLGTQHGNGSFH